jgi:hypothetical protein
MHSPDTSTPLNSTFGQPHTASQDPKTLSTRSGYYGYIPKKSTNITRTPTINPRRPQEY